MRITSNFSTPSFKQLYATKATKAIISGLTGNAAYEKAFRKLADAASGKHVLLAEYADKGVFVQVVDPNTFKPIRKVAYNDDFIQGIQLAGQRMSPKNTSSRSNTKQIVRCFVTSSNSSPKANNISIIA